MLLLRSNGKYNVWSLSASCSLPSLDVIVNIFDAMTVWHTVFMLSLFKIDSWLLGFQTKKIIVFAFVRHWSYSLINMMQDRNYCRFRSCTLFSVALSLLIKRSNRDQGVYITLFSSMINRFIFHSVVFWIPRLHSEWIWPLVRLTIIFHHYARWRKLHYESKHVQRNIPLSAMIRSTLPREN